MSLTPEEIAELVEDTDWFNFPADLVKATEAKINEKNPPIAEIETYIGNGQGCAPFNQVKFYSGGMPSVGTKLYESPMPTTVAAAMAYVIQAIRSDPAYAWSWHCNLAMASFDEGMEHKAANKAAARFMQILAKVDTSLFPEFKEIVEGVEEEL